METTMSFVEPETSVVPSDWNRFSLGWFCFSDRRRRRSSKPGFEGMLTWLGESDIRSDAVHMDGGKKKNKA